MAKQNVSRGANLLPLGADTPLHEYAPGALAGLNARERGQRLKRRKNLHPGPALLSAPKTVLSG